MFSSLGVATYNTLTIIKKRIIYMLGKLRLCLHSLNQCKSEMAEISVLHACSNSDSLVSHNF